MNQKPSPTSEGFCRTPYATELTHRWSLGRFHCRTRREADYSTRVKVMVKVLDFVQLGGPNLTVDSTVFEMCMDL